MTDFIPQLPLGDWFEVLVDLADRIFGWLFNGVNVFLRNFIGGIDDLLTGIPAIILIPILAILIGLIVKSQLTKRRDNGPEDKRPLIIGGIVAAGVFAFFFIILLVGLWETEIGIIIFFTILAWLAAGRITLTVLTALGLLLIYSMGLWESAIATIALVLVSSLMALIIGIPVGILAAKKASFGDNIVRPVLDFMQTMPAFVYLIPAIILFQRGNVAGSIATIIFAMPPVVRLTNLGIRQVPGDVMEAAKSLGSTGKQLLLKIQLPIALPTILAGINQTIMLALSMVVIASMIGAGGLGYDVRSALSRVDIAYGFEAGVAVVILAMIIDRMTQALGDKAPGQ